MRIPAWEWTAHVLKLYQFNGSLHKEVILARLNECNIPINHLICWQVAKLGYAVVILV